MRVQSVVFGLWIAASTVAAGGAAARAQVPGVASQSRAEIAQVVSEANAMLEEARITADATEKAQLLAQAREYYGKLLHHEDAFYDAMFGLAEVARMQGSWGAARDRYNDYIATPGGENDFRAYEGLGRVYLNSRYFRQARPRFRQATQLNPASATAWEGYAKALRGLGEIEDAYRAAAQSMALEPNNVDGLETFADVCLATVRPQPDGQVKVGHPEWLDEGLRACNRAISALRNEWERDPKVAEPLERIDKFHDTIIEILQFQLRSTADFDVDHLLQLVAAWREQRRIQDLLSHHKSHGFVLVGLAQLPDDVRLLLLAAQIEQALGVEDECRKHCEKVLEQDPDNADARAIMDALPE